MALGTLALCAVYTLLGSGEDAIALVRRAIEKDARTTYTCIRVWRSWGSDEPVKVRRDQSASGANRTFVLAPIEQQGFTIVDNGKQRATYDPDRRELIIQDSPLRSVDPVDSKRRMALLEQNYKISREALQQIAGRDTVRVLLKPASKAMFVRTYWIDKEEAVLLRVQWEDPSGRRQLMSDTITIEFPASLPSDTFASRFVGSPRKIEIKSPRRQRDFLGLSKSVGFSPINPIRMPYGLRFIGAEAIKGSGNRTMAAVRYTDGAANVTVYQASVTAGGPPWPMRGTIPREPINETWVRIEGDVPTGGKQVILGRLKESSPDREAVLRKRAARYFGVDADIVKSLRSAGLGFDEVVAVLAAGKNRPSAIEKGKKLMLEGEGIERLAKANGVSLNGIRNAIKRFWDMRA